MRLRQQHRRGESARRRARHRKGVKQLGHRLQARSVDRLHAPRPGACRFGKPVRVALAAMKIGGEVESLHGVTLRQFLARIGLARSKKTGALGQCGMLKTSSLLICAAWVAWLAGTSPAQASSNATPASPAATAATTSATPAPTFTNVSRGSWASASRRSAGIAPDPAHLVEVPIVQVYAARTYGWRGYFAVHPWIIYKRQGEAAYTRFDVVGWRAPDVVQRNYAVPDGLWYGAVPELLVDQRGEGVEAMIDAIEAAVLSYPFDTEYRSYPGPNSNTFLAHIGREVPALQLDLPPNAIGKDYRSLSHPVGRSSSGSGVQVELLGLLGVSVGLEEGLEFNVLGLNFGIDLNRPALRLPFLGRVGFSDVNLAPAEGAAPGR